MFAKAGLQDRLGHFDYGSWPPDNTPEKYGENIERMQGGAERFEFDISRFWLYVAGSFEVAYQGIRAADPNKRKYCTLVSQSPGNEKPKGPRCHDREDCENLGLEFIRIKGGPVCCSV